MDTTHTSAETGTARDSREQAVKHGFTLALETIVYDLQFLISYQRQLKNVYLDKGDLAAADAAQNHQWGLQQALDRVIQSKNCLGLERAV